jgi:hypothetical protein
VVASPFHRTAMLSVELTADVVRGSLIGLDIGRANLEPRLLEPSNLAQLVLVGPAEVLLTKDPAARIVILLDALDEAASEGSHPNRHLKSPHRTNSVERVRASLGVRLARRPGTWSWRPGGLGALPRGSAEEVRGPHVVVLGAVEHSDGPTAEVVRAREARDVAGLVVRAVAEDRSSRSSPSGSRTKIRYSSRNAILHQQCLTAQHVRSSQVNSRAQSYDTPQGAGAPA